MKIAVHAGTLRGAGSRAVGLSTLSGLCLYDHRYLAWIPREWPACEDPKLATLRTSEGALSKFRLETSDIPRGIAAFDAHALLSLTDTSCPQPGVPHVLLVQQAFLAHAPASLEFPQTKRFRAQMQLMAAYFRLGLPNVNHFVVQTQDMKARMSARWNIEPTKITVIPSCVGPEVHEAASRRRPAADSGLLCITSPSPHKGHAVLPETLRRLPQLSLAVTLTQGDVPSFDQAVERLGLRHRIEYLGSLSRPALLHRLQRARVAIIPSDLESFGLPYYEALALGVPVVAADREFAREACGEAGRYARSASEYAEAIHALVSTPGALTEASELGRARFEQVQVSSDEIARRYLSVLESAT